MKLDSTFSETAMILAAGFGRRMRPLTEAKPKPLLEVGGCTMLDRAIDHLKIIGVRRVVVNGHYLADQIEAHLKKYKDIEIIFSFEKNILDTGGGVKYARHYFGNKPFFLLGGDLPLIDGDKPTLRQLVDAWDGSKMDELMLMYPTLSARGFDHRCGDFMLESDGRLKRKDVPTPLSHVWLSAQIVKPRLYDSVQEEVFSNAMIFDRCEKEGRLYGVEHQGTCYHVGTPEDLKEAQSLLDSGDGWE